MPCEDVAAVGQILSLVRDDSKLGHETPTTKHGICFQRVTSRGNEKCLIESLSQSETVSCALEHLSCLDFGLWRRQIAGFDKISKANPVVRSIAEGFVRGLATSAKANDRATCQAKGLASWVHNLKVALDPNRTVTVNCNFRGSHKFPFSQNIAGPLRHSTCTSRSFPFLTS
jgi:hypothetical protein